MTDFWPGQDPWSAFEQNPVWDGASEPELMRADDADEADARQSDESSHEVAFVQQAIQRVYHS